MGAFFDYLIKMIGSIYDNCRVINNIIGSIITFLCAYKTLYIIIGIFLQENLNLLKRIINMV